MPKAKKLTDYSVAHAKPALDAAGKAKVTYFFDALRPGLALVVQKSGTKSWKLQYRRQSDGKQRWITYDGFPSLATARRLAQADIDAAAEGSDPAAEIQEAKRKAKDGIPDQDLFRAITMTYLKHYQQGRATRRRKSLDYKPKPRTVLETARLLGLRPDKDAPNKWQVITGGLVDLWGDRRMRDISKRDVIELLDGIVDKSSRFADRGAPYVANRTYAALSPLFDWAVDRDIIEVSPVRWNRAAEEKRDRVLSNDEIRWFWTATGSQEHGGTDWPYGPLFRLLLLTGQRVREVGDMVRAELDIDNRLWTIPGERTKNGQANMLPMSDEALAIIEALPVVKSNPGYMFTTNGKTPVSGYYKARLRCHEKMLNAARNEATEAGRDPDNIDIPHWSPHDLRRTFATKMNDEVGIMPHVVEAMLNHISGSAKVGVAGVYNRAQYLKEKEAAAQAWGRWIAALTSGQPTYNVVPLRQGA